MDLEADWMTEQVSVKARKRLADQTVRQQWSPDSLPVYRPETNTRP